MEKKGLLPKILAIIGAVFVWIPVLAPFFFSAALLIRRGVFGHFDYLMPAEFFPVALLGGVLLLWATLWVPARRGLIGWAFGVAIVMLFGGQVLAIVTGLASGETEPAGWWWVLVVGSLAIYTLAVVVMGVGGILLLRDLFRTHKPEPAKM